MTATCGNKAGSLPGGPQKGRKSSPSTGPIVEFPMRGIHLWAGAAIASLVVGMVAWLFLSPGWAIGDLQQHVQVQLGRKLEVKGGAALSFSPSLAIRLDQVTLSANEGQDDSFIAAKSIYIPMSLAQFLTRDVNLGSLILEEAEFAFLVDERGGISWGFPSVKTPAPLRLDIKNGTMRYFDARNGQSLSAAQINALVEIDADGEIAVRGAADLGGRLARIEAHAKSLSRIHEDGSPLDITVVTPEASTSFTGRIGTAMVLGLTGPVVISGPSLRAAAHWAGLPAGEGAGYQAFSIQGGLDSVGRAFAVRNAALTIDDSEMNGDVVLDLRETVPKFQAAVTASTFDLAKFLPDSGRTGEGWGSAALGFAVLNSFDAEITLSAADFRYKSIAMPSRLVMTISKGKLDASLSLQGDSPAANTIVAAVDASTTPPVFSMSMKAEGVDAQALLPGLAGAKWLSGNGSLSAALSGTGNTQQEIIGTLKGDAAITLANGQLDGIDITGMLGAISQRIHDGWTLTAADRTEFSSLSASFSIVDGIASFKNFRLQNTATTTTATGDIDLLRRALDVRAEPLLLTGEGGQSAGLPVPVVVKGPWHAPRIYPDMKDILLNPQAAFETLKTMGLTSGN
jgi:AsmA protein